MPARTAAVAPRRAEALTGALLDWYAREGRDLPWRRTTDPYAILVSEVMCQQTQVARVVPRYEAWLERWPTAASLAAASTADVLREWVGLGYNRRALRLREACVVVARDGWPEDLRTLPGVGEYTAAALGSFAFGHHVVAIDTNARRLFARVGDGLAPPPGRAADFNQATMELGALVCTARVAHCDRCPLAAWCDGPDALPVGFVALDEAGASASAGRVRERFEDSNRWVRGRVVAALAAGGELPEDVDRGRLERALDGLVRDGLVSHDGERYVLGAAS